jgi:hypothetical protein
MSLVINSVPPFSIYIFYWNDYVHDIYALMRRVN